jgi:hypothetical protein
MPLLQSVIGVWKAVEGSRMKGKDMEDQCKKTRMGECGIIGRIPSLLSTQTIFRRCRVRRLVSTRTTRALTGGLGPASQFVWV